MEKLIKKNNNIEPDRFIDDYLGLFLRDLDEKPFATLMGNKYRIEINWKNGYLVTLKDYNEKTVEYRFSLYDFIGKFYNPDGYHSINSLICMLV